MFTRLNNFSLGSSVQTIDKIVADGKHVIMTAPVYSWDVYDYVAPFISTYSLYDFTPVNIIDVLPSTRVIDIALCDSHMAIVTTSELLLYQKNGDNYNQITAPSVICERVAFSPDGLYMAVASSTDLVIYKLVGGTYTQVDTELITSSGCNDIEIGTNYLVLILDGTSSIYKRTGDTFSKLTDIGTGKISASLSPDETYLACTYPAAPYLEIYKRTDDTFTLLTGIPIQAYMGFECDFSPDGNYLIFAQADYSTLYKRNGDVFEILESIDLNSDMSESATFNKDNSVLLGVSGASSYVITYQYSSGLMGYVITDTGIEEGQLYVITDTGVQELTQSLVKE